MMTFRRSWPLAAIFVIAVAWGAARARADPYWIAYEGDVFPEEAGWERIWGDEEGHFHGPGAIRTLEDGILSYDTTFDLDVYEYSIIERPGAVDPGPGETFVAEWRLKVEEVIGIWNGGVGIFSDDAWALGLRYAEDHIVSVFEQLLEIPIEPGIFHDYRVTSNDMRTYALYIDGELAREGDFVEVLTPSVLTWGAGTQGGSGIQHWDYVRFRVVPEPPAISIVLLVLACHGGRRVFSR